MLSYTSETQKLYLNQGHFYYKKKIHLIVKVKAKEHASLQIQNLQILPNLIFFRCIGMTELVYHLLFLVYIKKSTQQLKANKRKIVPLTSCRLCLQSGQLGRWSKQRSIHSLQKVWPHGVVTGSYNILRRKRPSLVGHRHVHRQRAT